MRSAHAQEQAAAKLLAAVKGGQSLADAAAVAGVTVRRTPLVTRGGAAEGMPPQLEQALFALKKGEPTMVETGDGFIVAVPAEIVEADPKADPAGYDQVRAGGGALGRHRSGQPSSPTHCARAPSRASISRSSTTSLVSSNERLRPPASPASAPPTMRGAARWCGGAAWPTWRRRSRHS